jgi:hypothetical protein
MTQFRERTFVQCEAKFAPAFNLHDRRPTSARCALRIGTLFMAAIEIGRADIVAALQARMKTIYADIQSLKREPLAAPLFKLIAAMDYEENEDAARAFREALKSGDERQFNHARVEIDRSLEQGR